MLADYMEKGFLENIEDMLRHDTSLYEHLPTLITDERSRVRIGTVALTETLVDEHRAQMVRHIPGIAEGLNHKEPTIRGDVVYLLSIIGHKDALPYLEQAAERENVAPVRDEMIDTIRELKG
jgi:hypothetical protein